MEWISQPEGWIALVSLTTLEIVLGIDNIVFISILAGKLPLNRQKSARLLGLGLAMFARLALLLSLSWIMRLTTPWLTIGGYELSGRDLILFVGGLFLLAKATYEIHESLEETEGIASQKMTGRFLRILVQIVLLDIVFSFDSVITAVGMTSHLSIMMIAIILAIGVMMILARPISQFVLDHPTVKMLALSFLILIGVSLIAEALTFHIPKGYIYFAMGFSVLVEMLNLKIRKRAAVKKPIRLRARYN